MSGGAAAIETNGRRSLRFPLGRSLLGEDEADLRSTAEQLAEENSELMAQLEDERRKLRRMQEDRKREEQLIRTISAELSEL